jgi:hypothetical protein
MRDDPIGFHEFQSRVQSIRHDHSSRIFEGIGTLVLEATAVQTVHGLVSCAVASCRCTDEEVQEDQAQLMIQLDDVRVRNMLLPMYSDCIATIETVLYQAVVT